MTSLQQSLVDAVRLGPCGRVFGWLRGTLRANDDETSSPRKFSLEGAEG